MKNRKNNVIIKFLLFVLCWNIILFPVLYFSAKHRANRILNPYMQEVKDSLVINSEFGDVKSVKIIHIFNYTKRKMNHSCVDMKIATINGKYKICTILENKFQGYIYNGKILEEVTKKSAFEIGDTSDGFDRELYLYLNGVIDYPKTREPIVYKIGDNRYQVVNICKYLKENECSTTNDKYLNSLVDNFKDKYHVKIIEKNDM